MESSGAHRARRVDTEALGLHMGTLTNKVLPSPLSLLLILPFWRPTVSPEAKLMLYGRSFFRFMQGSPLLRRLFTIYVAVQRWDPKAM